MPNMVKCSTRRASENWSKANHKLTKIWEVPGPDVRPYEEGNRAEHCLNHQYLSKEKR